MLDKDIFHISGVLYQEGDIWIAQGLEFDIGAQGATIIEACNRFAMTVASEMAISLDLGRKPLAGIGPAPKTFWQLFKGSSAKLELESEPVRVDHCAPQILPSFKVVNAPQHALA